MPRFRFLLIPPQQSDQMIARAGALGRAGEVDEEREVLLPLQVGRRRPVREPNEWRAQRLTKNHALGGGGHCSAAVRAAALSARARYNASPSAQARRTSR